MPIHNNINNEYRENWTTHVKINGVWRQSDVYNKINGVWRQTYQYHIDETDVVGFKLIYKLVQNARYPTLPNLRTNTKIPVQFSVAGEDTRMNLFEKGVLYTYGNDWWIENYEEGIVLYQGILYAEINNDTAIAVSLGKVSSCEDEIMENIPGVDYTWDSDRIGNFSITIGGYTHTEGERRLIGWNSLFTTENHLSHNDYNLFKDPYVILPIGSRSSNYSGNAMIGIARSLTTAEDNMLGSWGHMSHTITEIKLNGRRKPFTIEIIN